METTDDAIIEKLREIVNPKPSTKFISKENQIQILKNWRDVCGKQKDLERHLLKLARHPESTTEQLETARDVYRKSYASLREMEKVLVGLGLTRHYRQSVSTVTLTEV